VERPFDYVEKNLLNGRTFSSLEHLNEVTQWWLEHVADVRIHRETKQRPRERHQAELPHLIPLPAQAYETAEVVCRCVNGEGLIVYCQNYYSVPDRYLGLMLPVRITEAEVIIYGPHVEEIARHPRHPREVAGQISRLAEHEQKPDEAQQAEALQQRYAELGEWATRFLAGLPWRSAPGHGLPGPRGRRRDLAEGPREIVPRPTRPTTDTAPQRNALLAMPLADLLPIDYAALRAQLPMSQVLELLAFRPMRVRGPQLRGPCPLPDCLRDGRPVCTTSSDTSGQYTILVLGPGIYDLEAQGAGTFDSISALEVNHGDLLRRDLIAGSGAVVLTVTDRGAPVDGVSVSIAFVDGDEWTTYVLHVAADNGANTALMAFNADLGIPFATFENGQFTNPVSPYDVNGDGRDTPLEALQAINEVNLRGPHLLRGPHQDPPYFDVNQDEYLTPLDVLHVINRLNQQILGGEAEANLAGLAAEWEASGRGVFGEDLADGADRLWIPADKGPVMVAADRGASVDRWTARTQESAVGTKSAPIARRAVAKEADVFQDFDAWDAGLEPLLDELAIGLLTQRRL
jgi:hypothetical protein